MKAITFEGQNVTFAENQPEYIPLPTYRDKDGTVTTCWQFSLVERIRIFFGAKLFWQHLTFNQPLQPVKPTVGTNPISPHPIKKGE